MKVVDIADCNGEVDFDDLKDRGFVGAIIRCGYGSDAPNQDDKQFLRNVEEAKRVGFAIGVYIYSYAVNTDEANSEVQHVLRALNEAGLNPIDAPLGVYTDQEDSDGYRARHGIDFNEVQEYVTIFYDNIKAAGFEPGVYANTNWFNNFINTDDLPNDMLIWRAHWRGKDSGEEDRVNSRDNVWQYMSGNDAGDLEATDTGLDENYIYFDFDMPDAEDAEQEEPEHAETSDKYSEGDKVRVLNAVDYNGNNFVTYYDVYDVIEVRGDRVVIGIDGQVTAAVNESNIALVGSEVHNAGNGNGDIIVGSKVRVTNAVDYNGNNFVTYYDVYDVIEVNGDRVVIGIGTTVTAAVNKCNLELL